MSCRQPTRFSLPRFSILAAVTVLAFVPRLLAADDPLMGHWRLEGDARDASSNALHA
ncbi:MAG TPA: hypothetical protein PKM43_15255 [Verrucomicrobiota bacterium]|nr:hypothetical protein [Verrucomicrobiota bacterium]HRZ37930.1 hypothetical protein [Candidatus Paceibacterota bacterium]HRZ56011.1 hypothetical protein [Candidatus Paceibacterota bacterium]